MGGRPPRGGLEMTTQKGRPVRLPVGFGCPECGHQRSRVSDTRGFEGHACVRRRRKCSACGCRFTTYEKRKGTAVEDGRATLLEVAKTLRAVLETLELALDV